VRTCLQHFEVIQETKGVVTLAKFHQIFKGKKGTLSNVSINGHF